MALQHSATKGTAQPVFLDFQEILLGKVLTTPTLTEQHA